MDLLPYIAASYALGILIPGVFAVTAFLRVGAARRRLAAIDPRANRASAGTRTRLGGSQ
ncbi:MAG TPA: hypothetical protein VME47_01545 [Acetobacteraceae bacterium]|nr:hypothetical protein [Acetobacteraceae bacterium]